MNDTISGANEEDKEMSTPPTMLDGSVVELGSGEVPDKLELLNEPRKVCLFVDPTN